MSVIITAGSLLGWFFVLLLCCCRLPCTSEWEGREAIGMSKSTLCQAATERARRSAGVR